MLQSYAAARAEQEAEPCTYRIGVVREMENALLCHLHISASPRRDEVWPGSPGFAVTAICSALFCPDLPLKRGAGPAVAGKVHAIAPFPFSRAMRNGEAPDTQAA